MAPFPGSTQKTTQGVDQLGPQPNHGHDVRHPWCRQGYRSLYTEIISQNPQKPYLFHAKKGHRREWGPDPQRVCALSI